MYSRGLKSKEEPLKQVKNKQSNVSLSAPILSKKGLFSIRNQVLGLVTIAEPFLMEPII